MLKQATRRSTKPEGTYLIHRVREGVLIFTAAISVYLMLALLTYHRTDPGWSGTGMMVGHIANAGGRAGAWFSDVFLYGFGYLAYLFPFMMVYSAWLFSQGKILDDEIDYRVAFLRCGGFVLMLMAGCGLSSLHFSHLAGYLPFSTGGILGNIVGYGLIKIFNLTGTTLLLLAAFLSSVTLLTGMSWLTIVDGTGWLVLSAYSWLMERWASLLEIIDQRREAATVAEAVKLKPALKKPVIKREPRAGIKIEAKAAKIEPSVRAEKERQVPLFEFSEEGKLPSLGLLDPPEKTNGQSYSNETLEIMSREVEARLSDFGIDVQVVAVHPGPVITRFELQLAAGVKVSKITSLAKDLARSLSVVSVRIVEVIPGKSVIGLELPNESREVVRLSEVLASQQYDQARSPLSLALGKDIAGHPVVVDLAKMPHLLVAGTTGSGKSVGLNAMLLSLLYKATPEEVRMIMIDPKMLELSIYEGIPHLLAPVVIDMKQAANALRWCVAEMERRYLLMASLGVRNLAGYNSKIRDAEKKGSPMLDPFWQNSPDKQDDKPQPLEALPYIVVLVDEFADMMMVVGKKVEELIARIAQKARAAGIHLILATQRPSVDVITGLIKANIPTRIAFQVSSKIDSRTILDQQGAEQLLGYGDMLYLPPGTGVPVRVHGAYVADHEVHAVVNDLKNRGQPVYIDEILETGSEQGGFEGEMQEENAEDADPLYDQAVQIVLTSRRASISSIQRRLKIGYNRAARMIEVMEAAGLVSPMESNGSREVLVPSSEEN